ncbi:type I polyketide synthase [Marivita hallyeonensis]|uniref:Acyl transferase domain-containing protein n=1 Tax=Marivita hallyeonensis TaxID=996342 RepID=A0A1M5UPZ2_9RHOB|nr:type I polyketide synthase [Marivita hallyeonensis]SHH65067.1 Acyl transferase domain-containing protein [Marivita hallyeonensis]
MTMETTAPGAASETDIAIVGMSAHLPGASSLAEYWRNLRDGVSSIRRLNEDELISASVPQGLLRHRDYVPYAALLDGYDQFDAEFFGLSPKDAAIMDPQHRQFLECAWEALENAGHMPERYDGRIGVFGGCGMGSYFYFNLCSNTDLVDNTGMFLLRHTGNDKDFLTTRVSHIFDLDGPSVSVQTACSTSLVATHYACQSLLNGECDMALAGGVTIEMPQGQGYLYKENEILSPDGQCHAFDHRAQGTVFGSGAGIVVLRRLSDALADGDHIWAVIKGSAVNNDGAAKAGYLAPSVDGQSEAISEAHAIAGVTADSIDYVECHGTGTYLGDPIEVAALTQAFQETSDKVGHCRIGSVKTNIGHLDTAAGVASLIKASMALHNHQMPPSLGFEKPNPTIDFETSPFRVNDRLSDWPRTGHPRRAGVNSLGVGGTNAHVVLEEAPDVAASEDSDWPFQILTVSARNKAALDGNAQQLAAHLRANADQPLADVAWTLKEGRRAFEKRRIVVAADHLEAARLLEQDDTRRVHSHEAMKDPDVAFLFPGGGAQYVNMARDLYETEPVFAEWMDHGLTHLETLEDRDIRALWLPEPDKARAASEALRKPSLQLPLIMIVEYALAQLWMSWGVEPSALAGHSMGENTAACVAGVMSFEDCIGLVHLRGSLFDTVEKGGMLSVALPAEELKPFLKGPIDLGAINSPGLSVASGPNAALMALEKELKARDVDFQRIPIDIAAHSHMLEPILDRFRDYLKSIDLHPPQIPMTSNATGTWMTDEQATDPDYWVGHLRGTVHFAQCLDTLSDRPSRIYLEVGPGKALSALARQCEGIKPQQVLSSLRHPEDEVADDRHLLEVLGRIWALGGEFDWAQIWGDARRNRVPLPTYAFQRSRYFIERSEQTTSTAPTFLSRIDGVENWGWTPSWRPKYADAPVNVRTELGKAEPQSWLMFMDDCGVAAAAARRIRAAGHAVVEVWPGDSFARLDETTYALAPERGREGYDLLFRDMLSHGLVPSRIAHFWGVTKDKSHRPGSSFFHRVQEHGFYSLLFIAQAIADETLPKPAHINVFTNDAAALGADELLTPEKAILSGPARVIPREIPNLTVSSIDVQVPMPPKNTLFGRAAGQAAFEAEMDALTDQVLEDLIAEPRSCTAALRDGRRYEQSLRKTPLTPTTTPALKPGGTYLITGGFGGIGLTIAKSLAAQNCTLVLTGREALPDRAHWDRIVQRHAPQDKAVRRIQAVQELEALGATVLTFAADVCNLIDMTDVVTKTKEVAGRIDGVIHAAGIIDDAPLLSKTTSAIEQVFSAKIHGTKVLDALFPDGETDFIVLFSSSSTQTAPAGQVDYVAANEYLNAFARSRKGGSTSVVAINWGIWAEVGMAADALADRTGDRSASEFTDIDLPLLQSTGFDPSGHRVFHARYSTQDWFIDEHRTKRGDALFPGAGYLTLAAQALRGQGEGDAFAIRNMTFLRPLHVADTGHRDIRLRLTRGDEGYHMDVMGDGSLDGTKGFAPVVTAELSLIPQAQPQSLDIEAIRKRCGAPRTARNGQKLAAAQETQLAFGPRWKTLDTCAFGDGEGIAELSLNAAAKDDDGWHFHPALLDIATGWAMELIEGYRADRLWVPVSYADVRVFHRLPERVISWVRSASANRNDDETASFDITLAMPDGTVCMEIAGFSIKRLDDLGALTKPAKIVKAEFEPEDFSRKAQPLSAAEERLQYNLSQGIEPKDGAEAFQRALALKEPQIVVSSLDMDALIEQVGASTAESSDTQKFDRPKLEGDYVAPETEVERTLVGIWEDLLGVQNVGVEDSFFDLGGHSLIAVRLFAKVRKTYDVDFPISILFEAPTIRACATLIQERTGITDSVEDAPKRPAKQKRRFKHLVAMHDGEGGPKMPFFLVAGMFGNVLNLRHLAQLLGTDRPFYGLQAKGLYGDEDPHTSIKDAARDYIAEMKLVQPHGPYFVGGFSGGGITAYEIAHQLERMGDEVAAIVLLDTPLPQRRPLSRQDRLLIQLHETHRRGVAYPFHWLRNRIRWEIDKRRISEDAATTHSFHNAEIERAFLSAVADYGMRPWHGRIALFRPPLVGTWKVSKDRWVNHERAYLFDDNDWGQFTPQIEVYEVPGDHDSMVLEPNVRVLASQMRNVIVTTEAKVAGNGKVLSFEATQAAE